MEALRGITIDAAWQSKMDDIVGSITVGKCADFVVLDRNPLEIPGQDILNIKVLQTWMNGRMRYSLKEEI